MLEDLNKVILNLEKSLDMLVHDEQAELLKHPEYLEAMKEVVQSINRVTRTLKQLEESTREERDQQKPAESKQASGGRTLSVVKNKSKDRRATSS